mgnify:CR=1 FL=1
MLIDFLALPLASLPLIIGFVRSKDRFVPGMLEDFLQATLQQRSHFADPRVHWQFMPPLKDKDW